MTTGATWIIYTGLAFFLMIMMHWTPGWVDWIFVRTAAILFMAAGLVGATGWLGNTLANVFNVSSSSLDSVATIAVGGSIMALVWFGLAVFWVACLLPDRWFSKQTPDWLSVGGLLLPAGIAVIPGPAGAFLMSIVTALSTLVTAPVKALFGG